MAVNFRLTFWLIRAYLKRSGKSILIYFFLGIAGFFILLEAVSFLAPKLSLNKKPVIGVLRAYTLDDLPDFIIRDLSSGLTTISSNGQPLPGLAKEWKITNQGKTYTFHLNRNK